MFVSTWGVGKHYAVQRVGNDSALAGVGNEAALAGVGNDSAQAGVGNAIALKRSIVMTHYREQVMT